MNNTKPFYKSKTIIAAIATVVVSFVTFVHETALLPELAPFVTDEFIRYSGAITAVTSGFVVWARTVSDTVVEWPKLVKTTE